MKKNNLFLLLLLNIQIIWSIDDVITDPAHQLDTKQPEDGDTEDSVFNGENNKNNENTIFGNSSQENFEFAGDSSGQTNNAQNSFDNSSSGVNENGITNAKVEATDVAQTVSRGLDFNGNPKLKGYSGGFRDAGPQNDSQNSDIQKDNFQKVKNRDKALNDRLDLLDRNLTKALDGNDQGQIDYTEKQVEAEEREYNSIKGRVDANNQKIGRDWNLSLSRFGRGRDRQEKTSARQRSLQQAKEKIDSLKQKIGNFKKSKDLNNQSQNKNEGLQQDDNQVTGDQEVPDTDSFSRPSSLISEAGSDEPLLGPSQPASEPQDLAPLRLSDSSNEGESSTDVQNGSVFSFNGQDYGNESSTDSGPTFSLEKSNEEESDIDEQVDKYDPNEMDKAMEEMGDENNNEDQEIDDWEGINIGERSKERVFGQNNEAKEGESSSVLPGDKLDYDGIYDKIWSDPNDPSGSYASNDDERNNDDEGNVEQFKKDLDASNLSDDQKEQLKNEFKESFPNSDLNDQDENNEQDFAEIENYQEEKSKAYESLSERIKSGKIESLEQLRVEPDYKKTGNFNGSQEEPSSMQVQLEIELQNKLQEDAIDKKDYLNEESAKWKDSSSKNYSKEYSELYDKIWSYPDDEKGSDYYAKDQLENDIKNTNLSADQKEQLRNEIDERDREDANEKSWQQERDEWWRQRAEKQEKEIQRRQQEEENARLKAQSKRRPFSWPK